MELKVKSFEGFFAGELCFNAELTNYDGTKTQRLSLVLPVDVLKKAQESLPE